MDSQMIIGRNSEGYVTLTGTKYGDLTLLSYDIMPNNYHDMCEMEKDNRIKVRLDNVISDKIPEPFRVELDITNDSSHDSFLVVSGGWLPCTFLKRRTILLTDRNVISRIQSRYHLNKKKKNENLDYFDSMFLTPTEMLLDVSPYVLEGNERKTPSSAQMINHLKEVTKLLKKALPEVSIAEYPPRENYYIALAECHRDIHEKRIDFFLSVASCLNRNFTNNSRKECIPEIFEAADAIGLPRSDIAVILAFLRINMVGIKTPPNRVIKDSQNYSLEDAYNAACDLMAIDILMSLQKFHNDNNSNFNIAFVTQDKNLAKVAALFCSSEFVKTDGETITQSCSFPPDIFADDEQANDMIKSYLSNN